MDYISANATPTTAALSIVVIIVASIFLVKQLGIFISLGPGPWGLPLFGYYPFLRKDFHVHLAEMVKKYGDAYLLSIMGKRYIHIGSHKALREAFVQNADCFGGRSEDVGVLQVLFKNGMTFTSNEESWRLWRRLVVQSMRQLGIGPKEQLRGPILDSLQETLDVLTQSKCGPVDLSNLLINQCTDTIRRLMLGENVSMEMALKLNKAYCKGNLLVGDRRLLLCGTIARYLVLNWTNGFNDIYDVRREMDCILNEIINDHRKTFDPEHPADLVDFYLLEKQTREKKGDPRAKYFNDNAFLGTIVQVFGDGGFTVGTFITCYLKDLASRLDIQDKIYEEISREIGTQRLPTHEDRTKLPYTNSVLKEIERMSSFFPVVPTLECNRDTFVSGVKVSKGTVVLVNLQAIHRDPTVYKDPDHFHPERFMANDNAGDHKVEQPVAFGIGRKACAGESLVKLELFVFVTSILQKFNLQLEQVKKTTSTDFIEILDYRFLAIPRKTS